MSRRCPFFLLPLAALILMGCPVFPGIPVSEIVIYIDQESEYNVNPIPVGGLLQLEAGILPLEASGSRLVWSSGECASVDDDGMVTGLAAANPVIIRATSVSNGAFGEIKITVTPVKDVEKM